MNGPVITSRCNPFAPGVTVVYWHPVSDGGDIEDPIVKADYRGAFVHVDRQDDVPPQWIEQAEQAAKELAAKRDADMSHMVTRDAKWPLTDDHIPVILSPGRSTTLRPGETHLEAMERLTRGEDL